MRDDDETLWGKCSASEKEREKSFTNENVRTTVIYEYKRRKKTEEVFLSQN